MLAVCVASLEKTRRDKQLHIFLGPVVTIPVIIVELIIVRHGEAIGNDALTSARKLNTISLG